MGIVNKQKQINNSVRYMAVMGLSSLTPLITLPIFTRILTKEDFGILVLAEIYAVLINSFVFMGLNAIYDCNFFKYREEKKKFSQLLYSILIFVVCNFFIFAGLTYTWKLTISHFIFHTAIYGNIIFFYFCAVFFDRLSEYYLSFFRNSEDADSYLKYSMIFIFINLFLSIHMVVVLKMGVIGIIYAKLTASVVLCLFLTYKFLSIMPFSLDKAVLMEALKMGAPFVPKTFFKVAGTKIDKYMINLLASLGGVGIYSIGQKISYLSFAFMTALENVFKPQMYKRMFDTKDGGGDSVGDYLMPFVYISIFSVLLLALFSEELILLLTPESYHGAIDVVAILCMFYAVTFFGKFTSNQFIFAKKTHIHTVLILGTYGLNIVLNIPFIWKWGAVGAAWATFLSGTISNIIIFGIAQKYYSIKWHFTQLAAIFMAFFIPVVMLIILRNSFCAYSVRLIIKCVALGFYLYLGVRMKIISNRNLSHFNVKSLLRGAVRKKKNMTFV